MRSPNHCTTRPIVFADDGGELTIPNEKCGEGINLGPEISPHQLLSGVIRICLRSVVLKHGPSVPNGLSMCENLAEYRLMIPCLVDPSSHEGETKDPTQGLSGYLSSKFVQVQSSENSSWIFLTFVERSRRKTIARWSIYLPPKRL